jgi:tRNA modification GTPase
MSVDSLPLPLAADTIFALSTPPGTSGVAVVRVSGAHATQSLAAFCPAASFPPVREAVLRTLYRPDAPSEPIDQAIIVWFKAPHSFTGEDCVEFHIHGSRAVYTELLECLSALPYFRTAEAGEFSKRAFAAGKMDLTQAEGLADLIHAHTRLQKRQAFLQMGGNLHRLYEGWRTEIIQIQALLEAYIDFPDEDIPVRITQDILSAKDRLMGEIVRHIEDSRSGERLKEGIRVVILGAPNAGKSSLLNALAKRDAAIVSHIAGTTRDVIEVEMDIGGYPITLVDTAGLRQSEDVIEHEGILRARKHADQADIRVVLFDGIIDEESRKMLEYEKVIVVLSKVDQGHGFCYEGGIPLSIKTGEGIPALLEAIEAAAISCVGDGTGAVITRQRYREALQEVLGYLEHFSFALPAELAAEDMRMAARAIGRITGRVDVEEILDVLFRQFCIGK